MVGGKASWRVVLVNNVVNVELWICRNKGMKCKIESSHTIFISKFNLHIPSYPQFHIHHINSRRLFRSQTIYGVSHSCFDCLKANGYQRNN